MKHSVRIQFEVKDRTIKDSEGSMKDDESRGKE